MQERIQRLIDRLVEKREGILADYLTSLEGWSDRTGLLIIERAALLHDLDRHLTNLNMEMRRLKAEERLKISTSDAIAGVNRGN